MTYRCTFAALITILSITSWTQKTTALTVDGSFESSSGNLPLNVPTTSGTWSGNGTRSVEAENGIIPFDGNRMIQFVSATNNFSGSTAVGSELYQLVDLASFSNSIATGNATASLTAYFNRVEGDNQTDTEFQVALLFNASLPTDFDPNSPLSSVAENILSDGDTTTWETVGLDNISIPAETAYLAIQLRAIENVFNDPSVPEFDGHYADAISLSITVPEPSSIILCLGLMVLFCCRQSNTLSALLICITTIGLAPIATAKTVSFSDDDFQDASWSTTVAIGGVGDSGTAQQTLTIGNPAPSRLVSITVNEPGPASVGVFSTFEESSLDPGTAGEVLNLSFSLDVTHVLSTESTFAHRVYAYVEQDGVPFISKSFSDVFSGDSGRSISFDSLVPTDFARFDGLSGIQVVTTSGVVPGFSATDSSISLGFMSYRGDSTQFGNNETHNVTYDNFLVSASVEVPEPSSVALFLICCSTFVISRRR